MDLLAGLDEDVPRGGVDGGQDSNGDAIRGHGEGLEYR